MAAITLHAVPCVCRVIARGRPDKLDVPIVQVVNDETCSATLRALPPLTALDSERMVQALPRLLTSRFSLFYFSSMDQIEEPAAGLTARDLGIDALVQDDEPLDGMCRRPGLGRLAGTMNEEQLIESPASPRSSTALR